MNQAVNSQDVRPQPKQAEFLSTQADIAIFGGSAGGGKTWASLVEPLRHIQNSLFGAVIFRRTNTQIKNEGGLWDASMRIYPLLGAHPREHSLSWTFPSGMSVSFGNLEFDNSVLNYSGAEIPLIIFDELQLFTEKQFFFMLSRNRSMSGVPGYVRATCNPQSEGWLRNLLDWWIDIDGYAIPSRSGKLRWFIRQNDSIIWADSREELIAQYGSDQQPKSLTFIPSKLSDNQILLAKDPSYRSNLMALDRVTRAQLLDGNWNIRSSAGEVFKREWFGVLDNLPPTIKSVRFWDRAATKPSESNKDPDYTVGVLLHKTAANQFVVADVRRIRDTSLKVQELILNTAAFDGSQTIVVLEQEPGSSGVADVSNLSRILAGFRVKIVKPSKDKLTRALPVAAQVEARNVFVLRAPWNIEFFNEVESFPDGKHDDQVDSFSGAFNQTLVKASVFDVL
jgi:predicted phage terminase large subunit-like protein